MGKKKGDGGRGKGMGTRGKGGWGEERREEGSGQSGLMIDFGDILPRSVESHRMRLIGGRLPAR